MRRTHFQCNLCSSTSGANLSLLRGTHFEWWFCSLTFYHKLHQWSELLTSNVINAILASVTSFMQPRRTPFVCSLCSLISSKNFTLLRGTPFERSFCSSTCYHHLHHCIEILILNVIYVLLSTSTNFALLRSTEFKFCYVLQPANTKTILLSGIHFECSWYSSTV